MLLFVQEAIARGKHSAFTTKWSALMGDTEEAVVRALKEFEWKASRGDAMKMADYTRLLDGQCELFLEPPAQMTLRWADKWKLTTSNVQ
jgi:hypothetical protein